MRGRILVVLAIAALLFVAYVFVAPFGYYAVRDACTNEGGLHISQTDNVGSYWHGGYLVDGELRELDCQLCIAQVARGDFEFVDFERTESMNRHPSGLVRFHLGVADRANCLYTTQLSKLPQGQCVVASKISRESFSRYRYRSERTYRKAPLGIDIREFRQSIYDTLTRKFVATHLYFDYATPAERSGDFERRYHCQDRQLDPSDANSFLLRVLRVADRPDINTSGENP
jgi:hypothetical protein